MGSVLGIAIVIGIVAKTGLNGGRDAGAWAWIDVVSQSSSQSYFPRFIIFGGLENRLMTEGTLGICSWLCQADRHDNQVHSPSLGKLPAQVYRWLEHQPDSVGSSWWNFVNCSACDRFKFAK